MTKALSIKNTMIFTTAKTRTIAAVFAIALAVALPQAFHVAGAIMGVGTAMGEIFLPMHLAIFAVGLLAGGYTGAVAGLLAPMISFFLTGMPAQAMLPYMMAELMAYGLIAGLLADKNLPVIAKLLIAQIGGRLVKITAIAIGVFAFSSQLNPANVIFAVKTGLPGLIIQWIAIPVLMYAIARISTKDE